MLSSTIQRASHSRVFRAAVGVVTFFICLTIGLAYPAAEFMSLTSSKFLPNRNSREAQWSQFTTRFSSHQQIVYNGFYVVLTATEPGVSLLTPCRQQVLEEYLALFQAAGLLWGKLTCAATFFSTTCVLPSIPPSAFIANNGSSILIAASTYWGNDPSEEPEFIQRLPISDLFKNSSCPTAVTVEYTGLLEMVAALKSSAIHDLETIDSFSLPIAFGFAAMCTKSVRTIVITVTMVAMSIALTFAILNPIAHQVTFSTVAPEVIVAVCAALSIDYSLFLLTRFREVRQLELERWRRIEGSDQQSAFLLHVNEPIRVEEHPDQTSPALQLHIVLRTVTSCSTNILFSAGTIFGVYLCLLMNQNDLIRGMAIGCAVGAAVCCIIAMVFAPCLMVLCYRFLTRRVQCLEAAQAYWDAFVAFCVSAPERVRRCLKKQKDISSESEGGAEKAPLIFPSKASASSASSVSSSATFDAKLRDEQAASPWFRLAVWVTQWPWSTLLLCAFIVAPFALLVVPWNQTDAPGFVLGFNVLAEVPTNAPPTILYRRIFETLFSPQLTSPFYLLFQFCTEAATNAGLCNGLGEHHYHLLDMMYQKLLEDQRSGRSRNVANVASVTRDTNGNYISYANASKLYSSCSPLSANASNVFCRQWNMLMATDGIHTTSAGLITIIPAANSLAEMGRGMFEYLDRILADYQPLVGSDFLYGLYGSDLDSYGCMREVYATVWWSLGAACGVIIVAMLVAFRSLMLSLRLLLTIAFTITISFGATVLLYTYDLSHHTGFGGLPDLVGIHSLQWVIPIVAAPLIAALAVDYDAFLLSRVIQLRRDAGFGARAAVVKSVYATGRVITYAAVIMTIAFGSLTLSHCIMLQQFGMMVMCAVLVDAIVVRSALVPALLMTFPRGMWWPLKMPVEDPKTSLGLHDVSLNE